jgi:AraC-like DNA-binding protein
MDIPQLVGAERYEGEADCPWHVHDGHELVLVERGRCEMRCGEEAFACEPGDMAVLPRGLPQYQRNLGFCATSYLIWRGGESIFSGAQRVLRLDMGGREVGWLHDCVACYAETERDQELLDALVLTLLRGLRRHEQERARADDLHPALISVQTWITQNLDRPLDLRDLAERVGLSEGHLARLFRQQLGRSPLRYQQTLRLRLAERLLLDPRLSAAEVGRRCGWSDLNYFCRIFSRHAGRPPGQWRGGRSSLSEMS